MKYEKPVYITGALIIIISAIMNILHIPFGNTLFVVGVVAILFYQNHHLKKLKSRIRELEEKDEL